MSRPTLLSSYRTFRKKLHGSPEAEQINTDTAGDDSASFPGGSRPVLTKLLNSSFSINRSIAAAINDAVKKLQSFRKFEHDETVPLARSPREVLEEKKINLTEVTVPQDELRSLMEKTNFCKMEIESFYTYFGFMANINCQNDDGEAFDGDDENNQMCQKSRGVIDRAEFDALFQDAGLRQPEFRARLWNYFHPTSSDNLGITEFEIVTALNAILRGTIEDAALMFFDLYDLHDNGQLFASQMIDAYSDMVARKTDEGSSLLLLPARRRRVDLLNRYARFSSGRAVGGSRHRYTRFSSGRVVGGSRHPTKRGISVMDAELNLSQKFGVEIEYNPPLTEKEKQNLAAWVERQKLGNSGVLDKATFVKGIVEASKTSETKVGCVTWRNVFYVILLGCFELGPLFMLLSIAAIPQTFMERLNITSAEIGVLTSVYFVAGMISPLFGGLLLDRGFGPASVTLIANTITAFGAFLQWAASSPSLFPLLVIARFLNGFGLEITFFTTNECFIQLFPDNAGCMVGVHTFFINMIFFLAFIVLPELGNAGPNIALGVTASLCVISTLASAALLGLLKKRKDSNGEQKSSGPDQLRITNSFAALAQVMTPHEPRGCRKWALPISFYLVVLGNKAIGYFFNTFSVFSVEFFSRRFQDISQDQAAFLTGIIGLAAGMAAPFLGVGMDKYGKRSLILASASGIGLLGFLILFAGNQNYLVFILSALLAIVAAISDLAISVISFVVGASRVGVGFGVYGLLGSGIDAIVSLVAGYLVGKGKDDAFIWFSAIIMLLGLIAWAAVYFLNRKRTFSEVPLAGIIETCAEDLHTASLANIIHACGEEEGDGYNVEGGDEFDGTGTTKRNVNVSDAIPQ